MIIYCCTDLIFATKIASTAEVLGVPSRPARDADALRRRLDCVDDGRMNEAVTGVLIDLELGVVALHLLQQVKAYDVTIPVVTFGSHVETDILRAAQENGADAVMPRSQFTVELPNLLRQYGEATT